MKNVSLRLPNDLEKDLRRLARARGQSKSQVMREALNLLIQQENSPVKMSALAMCEDLAGSCEGPEDLSHNPTHMDDFGRH